MWDQNYQYDLVFILSNPAKKTSGSFKGSDAFLCANGDQISHHLTAVSVNKIFN